MSGCTGYSIYEETNSQTGKDTSRMLRSGALKVYYIQVHDGSNLFNAFTELVTKIPVKSPIICESPSLANYVEPGIFAIMINDNTAYPKDITEIRKVEHIEMKLENMIETGTLPFTFLDGIWKPVKI